MRILFLRRNPSPDMRRWTDELAVEASRLGYQARIVDADDWMPQETAPSLNKETNKELRDLADGFDIVHAFGYRPAFACAEVFGDREIWMFSTYEFPRTTNPKLIERLNMAQCGTCSSRAVLRELEGAGSNNLEVLHPGVDPELGPMRDRQTFREETQIPDEVFVIGTSFVNERVLDACRDRDFAVLAYGTEREEDWPGNVQGIPALARPRELIGACDVWLSPEPHCGFSLNALDAMALSIPVLARHEGGFLDIVAEDVTGQFFLDDAFLGDTLSVLADMSLTLEAYGQAARVRLEEQFTAKRCAQRIGDIYGQWV